jgi:hypothetical protein
MEPYTPKVQEPIIDILEVKLVVSILVLVESNALKALESTINASSVILMELIVFKLSTLKLS